MSLEKNAFNNGPSCPRPEASSSGTASVDETMSAIRAALSAAGGAAAEYNCATVSWDDVSRGTVSGGLSSLGANITDSYLKARDGTSLFTVRSCNWNEKLGVVRASDVALLVGNGEKKGGGKLRNVTLEDFLKDPAGVGARYAGMKEGVSLLNGDGDAKVSIRFQTVFLPVSEDEDGRGRMQFAGEAYNYQTRTDEDPRNIVLLATTQGLSVQCDGKGAKRLLLHVGEKGDVSEYWLEAESSRHKVGGEQKETTEEREDALKRGKATSEVIGIQAMGTRFNVLMTIQVPLEQNIVEATRVAAKYPALGGGGALCMTPPIHVETQSYFYSLGASGTQMAPGGFGTPAYPVAFVPDGKPACLPLGAPVPEPVLDDDDFGKVWLAGLPEYEELKGGFQAPSPSFCQEPVKAKKLSAQGRSRGNVSKPVKEGRACAARVSRGDLYGKYKGLPLTGPKRNSSEHVTVTCVLYNTVIGGVPNEIDVLAAIDDMEMLYAACTESGRLADAAFDFMKAELTVADTMEIQEKITTQSRVAETPPVVATEPVSPSEAELVLRKFTDLESTISSAGVTELKLLVLGVVNGSHDAREIVSNKLAAIQERITASDEAGAKSLIPELRLLVKGALADISTGS